MILRLIIIFSGVWSTFFDFMLEIASLKIDNESHYLLIIPAILANVKKITINLRIIARIVLILLTISVNVKKICKKHQNFLVKSKISKKVLEVQLPLLLTVCLR